MVDDFDDNRNSVCGEQKQLPMFAPRSNSLSLVLIRLGEDDHAANLYHPPAVSMSVRLLNDLRCLTNRLAVILASPISTTAMPGMDNYNTPLSVLGRTEKWTQSYMNCCDCESCAGWNKAVALAN